MEFERSATLYDELPDVHLKPTTVDRSQITDLEGLETPTFDAWWSDELRAMTTAEKERRAPSGHGGLQAAISDQLPVPVVPLVVEAAELDDERDAKPSSRRRDRIPATSVAVSTLTPRHQSRPSYPFKQAALDDPVMTTLGGGSGFQQPFIPLSVCIPKEEPSQTVPCFTDAHKQQRKRERNRVAAQRCRQRKLEQISTLQDRVAKLNRTKSELERTVDDLRRQLDQLHHNIRQHVNAGCQLAQRPSALTFRLQSMPPA